MIKVPQEALDFIANGPGASGVLATPNQTAGEYLRSCRVAAGLGLTETAKAVGLSAVELGEIERDKQGCTAIAMCKLEVAIPGFSYVNFQNRIVDKYFPKVKPPQDALNPYFIVSELPKGTIPKSLDTARHNWAAALLHETDPDNRAIIKDEIRRILQFVVIYWEQDELMSRALAALKAWEE